MLKEDFMKPYGRITKRMYNYVDNHPPKGYVNWWEAEFKFNKKTERQKIKKEIMEELTVGNSQACFENSIENKIS